MCVCDSVLVWVWICCTVCAHFCCLVDNAALASHWLSLALLDPCNNLLSTMPELWTKLCKYVVLMCKKGGVAFRGVHPGSFGPAHKQLQWPSFH